MKKIVLAAVAVLSLGATAYAADRVTAPARPAAAPAPAPAPAPAAPWSGIYGGIFAGGIFPASSSINFAGLPKINAPGFTGEFVGGVIGADFQVDAWVFGIVGDFAWSNAKRGVSPVDNIPVGVGAEDVTCSSPRNLTTVCRTELGWLATARGRVGYAIGNMLLYGSGGAAWGNVRRADSNLGVTLDQNDINVGWTAGLGVDYLAGRNFVIGTEVLFVDLNNSGTYPASGTFAAVEYKNAFTTLRAKAALKFP